MVKNWILVYDSGNGGRWTLSKLKEILPNENYLFFMDKKHCPYGNKSVIRLKKIVSNNISKLRKKYNIKMLVIACNTVASTMTEYLKQKFYDLPIVFVTPCITPEIVKKPTLILATKNTVKTNQDIAKVKDKKWVYVYGFSNLAKKIDDVNGNFDLLQPYLNQKLRRYKNKKISNVVLGCTHFNYITEQIQNALKTKVDFFENSTCASLRAKSILYAFNMENKKKVQGDTLVVYKI